MVTLNSPEHTFYKLKYGDIDPSNYISYTHLINEKSANSWLLYAEFLFYGLIEHAYDEPGHIFRLHYRDCQRFKKEREWRTVAISIACLYDRIREVVSPNDRLYGDTALLKRIFNMLDDIDE